MRQMSKLLLATLVGLSAVSQTEAHHKVEIPEGTVTFGSQFSGKCLEIYDQGTEEGAVLVQHGCDDNRPGQQWQVTHMGNGFYSLKNVNSGLCLDVAGASKENGASIQQYPCKTNGNNLNQQFSFLTHNGRYAIVARHSGKALDVYENNKGENAPIKQYTFNTQSNQMWTKTDAKGSACGIPSEGEENCQHNQCCPSGYKCYQADAYYAQCRTTCTPNESWTCKVLPDSGASSPSAGQPASPSVKCSSPTAANGNCRYTECCVSGYTCYEANPYFAQCRKDCVGFEDWTCKKLS